MIHGLNYSNNRIERFIQSEFEIMVIVKSRNNFQIMNCQFPYPQDKYIIIRISKGEKDFLILVIEKFNKKFVDWFSNTSPDKFYLN